MEGEGRGQSLGGRRRSMVLLRLIELREGRRRRRRAGCSICSDRRRRRRRLSRRMTIRPLQIFLSALRSDLAFSEIKATLYPDTFL